MCTDVYCAYVFVGFALLRPKSTSFTTSGCPALSGLASTMLCGLKS